MILRKTLHTSSDLTHSEVCLDLPSDAKTLLVIFSVSQELWYVITVTEKEITSSVLKLITAMERFHRDLKFGRMSAGLEHRLWSIISLQSGMWAWKTILSTSKLRFVLVGFTESVLARSLVSLIKSTSWREFWDLRLYVLELRSQTQKWLLLFLIGCFLETLSDMVKWLGVSEECTFLQLSTGVGTPMASQLR